MATNLFYLVILTTILMSLTTSPSSKIEEDFGVIYSLKCGINTLEVSPAAGQIFTIKIRGNATTGYGWFLQNRANIDTDAIQALNLNEYGSSQNYITDEHEEGMVGVGGYYYFKFKALKSGASVSLVFIHKRPWETSPVRTVEVKVNIS